MDRARTEGALNHLGLFAFNWTRPRTNLSREREHQGRQGRVRDLSYFTANWVTSESDIQRWQKKECKFY